MLLKCHFQNIIFWKSKVDEHKRIANAMRLSMSKTFILRKFYSLINDHCLSWRCWTNCNETSSKHFRAGIRIIFFKNLQQRIFEMITYSFALHNRPNHRILLDVKPWCYGWFCLTLRSELCKHDHQQPSSSYHDYMITI